jgi:sporulation protein YlmC with PRC-barrel domain
LRRTSADARGTRRGPRIADGYIDSEQNGEEIGKVDDLLVDQREKKVRFIEISSGGVLGIGDRKFLMPVDAITEIDDQKVTVGQNRQKITGAPPYDPRREWEKHRRPVAGLKPAYPELPETHGR